MSEHRDLVSELALFFLQRKYEPGERVPSERELAERFKAGRGLVREALAYLEAQLDQRSSLSGNIYANWFQSGFAGTGDANALGAQVAYRRWLTNRLSGTVALGIDGINRQYEDDYWTASALAGLRYSF